MEGQLANAKGADRVLLVQKRIDLTEDYWDDEQTREEDSPRINENGAAG